MKNFYFAPGVSSKICGIMLCLLGDGEASSKEDQC